MRRGIFGVLLLLAVACGGSTTPTPTGLAPTTAVVHVLAATIVPTTGDEAVLSFSAHNAGAEPDTLVEASCTCAESTQIVGEGSIAPEETGLFGPNGDHVLLRGFDEDLKRGDFTNVTLVFANAEQVVTTAEVVSQ